VTATRAPRRSRPAADLALYQLAGRWELAASRLEQVRPDAIEQAQIDTLRSCTDQLLAVLEGATAQVKP
jgi:hypothetical protein